MPENFYEWVLDLERQIETLKNIKSDFENTIIEFEENI